jgi:hypothetical protein
MDVLLENVPGLVPSEAKVRDWFRLDGEELSLWKDVGGGGMLLGSGAAFGGVGKMVLTFRKKGIEIDCWNFNLIQSITWLLSNSRLCRSSDCCNHCQQVLHTISCRAVFPSTM